MGTSATDLRQKRLERYETSAAECETLARLAIDHSPRTEYENLAALYRSLASGFRNALAIYSTALAKLTLY
jgi:hypothetical protein